MKKKVQINRTTLVQRKKCVAKNRYDRMGAD